MTVPALGHLIGIHCSSELLTAPPISLVVQHAWERFQLSLAIYNIFQSGISIRVRVGEMSIVSSDLVNTNAFFENDL